MKGSTSSSSLHFLVVQRSRAVCFFVVVVVVVVVVVGSIYFNHNYYKLLFWPTTKPNVIQSVKQPASLTTTLNTLKFSQPPLTLFGSRYSQQTECCQIRGLLTK